jgi:hypothetical protein
MNFIKIGNEIINLMVVTWVEFTPAGTGKPDPYPDSVIVMCMVGKPSSVSYTGKKAEVLWEALRKAATPMENFGNTRTMSL